MCYDKEKRELHRRGLEPLTTRFEAGYSIQLSYRCFLNAIELYSIEKSILWKEINNKLW